MLAIAMPPGDLDTIPPRHTGGENPRTTRAKNETRTVSDDLSPTGWVFSPNGDAARTPGCGFVQGFSLVPNHVEST